KPIAPATSPSATPDPNAAARRDYELAAQVGTPEAWEAYLRSYQTGFYADLARAQLGKLVNPAEPDNARAAREKAERERQEKERLAREQAEKERQDKEQAEKRAEQERQSADAASGQKTAVLTPPRDNIAPDSSPALGKDALVREIKKELKRVGCYS